MASVAVVAPTVAAEPVGSNQIAADLDAAPAPGERALVSRLLAPCCWNQTLDVHESDLARDLRHEIRTRVHRGEPADVIERDLLARYGDRLRADPASGLLGEVALGLMLGIAVSSVGVLSLLCRWRRAGARSAPIQNAAAVAPPRDADDERLDDELRELDA